MRHGVYDIVEKARHHAKGHTVPMGVTLAPCSICKQPIERTEDAMVFEQTLGGPSTMIHNGCNVNQLQRIVRAMGRSGSRNLTVALRLDHD